MSLVHSLRLPVLGLGLSIVGLCHAQDLTFADVLQGDRIPLTHKLNAIPAEFRAAKITVESAGAGFLDGMGGLGLLMLGGANPTSLGPAAAISLMDAHWTKGEVVRIQGHEYLVTYKLDMGTSEMALNGPNMDPAKLEVRLRLVKTSSISAFLPRPDLNQVSITEILASVRAEAQRMGGGGFGAPTMADPSAPMVEMAVPAMPAPAHQTEEAAPSADHSRTMNNYRQIAVAVIMYASDHDDVLPWPQSIAGLREVIRPYLPSDSVWQPVGLGGGVRWNRSIGGVSLTSLEEPARTPMLYDEKPWPDGRRMVAFTDGHVKFVRPEEWRALQPNLNLKVTRTAKRPLPANLGVAPNARPRP